MELIYTNQLEDFDPDKRYRVASLFRSVERDATAVVVVGDFPEIVAAYEDAGVEVELVEFRRLLSSRSQGHLTSCPGRLPSCEPRTAP